MARPAKKLIHTPEQQIKDFFIDESMARVYPKNGYNVLWFMEELLSKEDLKKDFWVNFKKNILDLLSRDENVSHFTNPLKEEMIKDELVIKRVKYLINTFNVDINKLGLATKAVRMMSVDLINGLLELGLDPNVPDDKNLPLEVALNRKNMKIAEAYWNHPKINRYALNKDGENFAEIAIKYKQWKFFEIILKDEPNLIFGTKPNGELNVEKIIDLFNKQKFDPTENDLEVQKRLLDRGKKYYIALVPQRTRNILMELLSYCEKNNGHLNLSNPAIKKLWIEEFYSILSDKLQEDGNKKEKRLKI